MREKTKLTANILIVITTSFLLTFFFGPLLDAVAETIVFTSGRVIEAKLLKITSDSITLELFGTPATYRLQDIKSIDGEKIIAPPKIIQPIPEVSEEKGDRKNIAAQEEIPKSRTKESKKALVKESRGLEDKNSLSSNKQVLDSQTFFEKGRQYDFLGEKEKALQSYKEALKINPDLGQMYLEEGITQYFLNNYIQARENFQRAKILFEVTDNFQGLQTVEDYLKKLR